MRNVHWLQYKKFKMSNVNVSQSKSNQKRPSYNKSSENCGTFAQNPTSMFSL